MTSKDFWARVYGALGSVKVLALVFVCACTGAVVATFVICQKDAVPFTSIPALIAKEGKAIREAQQKEKSVAEQREFLREARKIIRGFDGDRDAARAWLETLDQEELMWTSIGLGDLIDELMEERYPADIFHRGMSW